MSYKSRGNWAVKCCVRWDCSNRLRDCKRCVRYNCYEKATKPEIKKARKFLYGNGDIS